MLAARLCSVITGPILSLARTAGAVSKKNDYTIRAVKESDDETGFLVVQFSEMLKQIQETNRALSENEYQMRLVTDAMPALISYVDSEERYQFNNATYEEWLEQSREALKGLTVREVLGDVAY
jgi:nitrogen fixation/metabolism regulation signal transduction histidine kinase